MNFVYACMYLWSMLSCSASLCMSMPTRLYPFRFMDIDYTVCTGCCGTLDHIVTFFFKNLSKSKAAIPLSPTRQSSFLRLLELHSDMFQQMLASIMNIIMFENCRCQWSMSRPLLGLILLNEEVAIVYSSVSVASIYS